MRIINSLLLISVSLLLIAKSYTNRYERKEFEREKNQTLQEHTLTVLRLKRDLQEHTLTVLQLKRDLEEPLAKPLNETEFAKYEILGTGTKGTRGEKLIITKNQSGKIEIHQLPQNLQFNGVSEWKIGQKLSYDTVNKRWEATLSE